VPAATIRFKAKLLQPRLTGRAASWSFVVLPKTASARLHSRGMATVDGTLNTIRFRATLQPDGRKSHWFKVSRQLRESAGAAAGDAVVLELVPAARAPEPKVPAKLRLALVAAPAARAVWLTLTPVARRDWIHWITSAKQAATRAGRIGKACSMLAGGKRRVCCFDRSGFYSKSLRAPTAAT
jgi:hypothetical protein